MKHLMYACAATAMMMAADTGSGSGGGKKAADAAKEAAKQGQDTTTGPASESAVDQANTIVGGQGDDAVGASLLGEKGEDKPEGYIHDLDAANAEVVALREELAAARLAHEGEVAVLRADAETAKRDHDDLKGRIMSGGLTTTQRDLATDALGGELDEAEAEAELFDVRVKTPMLVNPVPPRDYDPALDGLLPAAYPLVKGLNKVPRWVAESRFVRANLEPEA